LTAVIYDVVFWSGCRRQTGTDRASVSTRR